MDKFNLDQQTELFLLLLESESKSLLIIYKKLLKKNIIFSCDFNDFYRAFYYTLVEIGIQLEILIFKIQGTTFKELAKKRNSSLYKVKKSYKKSIEIMNQHILDLQHLTKLYG